MSFALVLVVILACVTGLELIVLPLVGKACNSALVMGSVVGSSVTHSMATYNFNRIANKLKEVNELRRPLYNAHLAAKEIFTVQEQRLKDVNSVVSTSAKAIYEALEATPGKVDDDFLAFFSQLSQLDDISTAFNSVYDIITDEGHDASVEHTDAVKDAIKFSVGCYRDARKRAKVANGLDLEPQDQKLHDDIMKVLKNVHKGTKVGTKIGGPVGEYANRVNDGAAVATSLLKPALSAGRTTSNIIKSAWTSFEADCRDLKEFLTRSLKVLLRDFHYEMCMSLRNLSVRNRQRVSETNALDAAVSQAIHGLVTKPSSTSSSILSGTVFSGSESKTNSANAARSLADHWRELKRVIEDYDLEIEGVFKFHCENAEETKGLVYNREIESVANTPILDYLTADHVINEQLLDRALKVGTVADTKSNEAINGGRGLFSRSNGASAVDTEVSFLELQSDSSSRLTRGSMHRKRFVAQGDSLEMPYVHRQKQSSNPRFPFSTSVESWDTRVVKNQYFAPGGARGVFAFASHFATNADQSIVAPPITSIASLTVDCLDEIPSLDSEVTDIFGDRKYKYVIQAGLPESDVELPGVTRDQTNKQIMPNLRRTMQDIDESGPEKFLDIEGLHGPLNMGYYKSRNMLPKVQSMLWKRRLCQFMVYSTGFGAPITSVRTCSKKELRDPTSLNISPLTPIMKGDNMKSCPKESELFVGHDDQLLCYEKSWVIPAVPSLEQIYNPHLPLLYPFTSFDATISESHGGAGSQEAGASEIKDTRATHRSAESGGY